MRRITSYFVFMFLIGYVAGTTSGQQRPNLKIEETLIGLEKQSWVAWQKRDGKFFDDFLSEDHVEVGPTGTTGKAGVVAFVGSPTCKVDSYKVDNFKVTIFDRDTALVTYRADQDTTCYGAKVATPVWVSSLFVRRNGKWQNAMYQRSAGTK